MDPVLQLAFSMQKNPGVYALLLGSGISLSADIPTGWEITQRLIEQIKQVSGKTLPESTGYDALLAELGKTQTERNSILRSYFEPSREEQEQNIKNSTNIKTPTKAHKAIAELVREGYIKVILTTNFDRLMEIALEDIGITPHVIRSDDMLKGTPPIRHLPITIMQLHGDYRDIRTLNTAEELGSYSQEKNRFLDSVFEEYGLIVCGWSAVWDTALRDAIFRTKQRWYSSYWVEPNKLSFEANDIIRHRNAELIISSADVFFPDLLGNVKALAKLSRQHPLTVSVATERVKRLLPLASGQIDLNDLLIDEAEHAYQQFSELELHRSQTLHQETDSFYKFVMSEYFARIEVVLNMVTTVCWYNGIQQTAALSAIANRWAAETSYAQEHSLRKIPCLLLIYAGGIASVHRSNWECLHALIMEPKVSNWRNNKRESILPAISKNRIFDTNAYKSTFGAYDPISKRLQTVLYPVFSKHFPFEEDFKRAFDLFEMILAVLMKNNHGEWIGHNAITDDFIESKRTTDIVEFWNKGKIKGQEWGFLRLFFAGDISQLFDALNSYRDSAVNSRNSLRKADIPDYAEIVRVVKILF